MPEKTYVATFDTTGGRRFLLFYAESKTLAIDHANHVAMGGIKEGKKKLGARVTDVVHYAKKHVNEQLAGQLVTMLGDLLR